MAAPLLTFTDTTSSTITNLNFGNVDAGNYSSVLPILVWNNLNGSYTLSSMSNTTITSVTLNGLGQHAGDYVSNGQQIVDSELLQVSGDSINWTPVGGANTAVINGATGTISGQPGGDYALVYLRLNAPTNVTAGAVSFYIRINYLYQ
jgi:hypothetical protein